MKQIFTLIFILVLATGSWAQNIGETPPDFKLKDLSEQDYTLSENKGKVIMIFLIGYNCPLCIAASSDIKSDITDVFESNANFQAVVIDVWDGSKTAVQGFANSSGINGTFLQKGSAVASSWSASHDRLYVVGSDGKVVFMGTKSAKAEVSGAKAAIQTALNNVLTSAPVIGGNRGFELLQNYPNPVSDVTTIKFIIDGPGQVNLSVFDISGKIVATPVRSYFESGEHELIFNRKGIKNGVYFYRLKTDNDEAVKRMVIQ